MSSSIWKESKVLVTGGASFIGSHLVDKLVDLGANVTVVDDLSSGKKENLQELLPDLHSVIAVLAYEAPPFLPQQDAVSGDDATQA